MKGNDSQKSQTKCKDFTYRLVHTMGYKAYNIWLTCRSCVACHVNFNMEVVAQVFIPYKEGMSIRSLPQIALLSTN